MSHFCLGYDPKMTKKYEMTIKITQKVFVVVLIGSHSLLEVV